MESRIADNGLVDKVIPSSSGSMDKINNLGKQGKEGKHPPTIRAKSTFRHLFAFTKREHTGSLALAIFGAACAAGFKVAFAVLIGQAVNIITPLGAGTISKDEAMANMTSWCIRFSVLGVAAWFFYAAFMASWIICGELVAYNTRKILFNNLLYKDMAWFDSQEDGISSVLSSIQV